MNYKKVISSIFVLVVGFGLLFPMRELRKKFFGIKEEKEERPRAEIKRGSSVKVESFNEIEALRELPAQMKKKKAIRLLQSILPLLEKKRDEYTDKVIIPILDENSDDFIKNKKKIEEVDDQRLHEELEFLEDLVRNLQKRLEPSE